MYSQDVGSFELAKEGMLDNTIVANTGKVLETHCLKKSLLVIASWDFIIVYVFYRPEQELSQLSRHPPEQPEQVPLHEVTQLSAQRVSHLPVHVR